MGRKRVWPPRPHLHRASGQWRVSIDGKQFYLGIAGSPEAQQAYGELIARVEAQRDALPPDPPRQGMTVAELCERYLAHARAYYVKDGKQTAQVRRVERALGLTCDRHATTTAVRFGPLALEEVREGMVSLGWKRGVVNAHVGCVKRAWRWAAARELIPASAAHALMMLPALQAGRCAAPESPPVAPVPSEVVDDTLPFLPPIVADMVRVQRLTGMRGGEVCSMRGAEIDRAGEVWLYRPASHKTSHRGKSRTVYLGPQAQAVLSPHLEVCGDGYLFSPQRSKAMFSARLRRGRGACNKRKRPGLRQPGERYSVPSYQAAIARAAAAAGVPHWHCHQLRHLAATEFEQRFGITAARELLGHSHAAMTERYVMRDAHAAIDAARKAG